ncbi:hypothetical protein Bca52824_000912 [Brassica carinata]|uniref:Uncharacterized protein n=1 Tax=Brassica carinata TaxID=52824 RepID=A0A8X7WI22_BRACI|nr:hypothetical protein Bca52824_000912 [Brassica carinata]
MFSGGRQEKVVSAIGRQRHTGSRKVSIGSRVSLYVVSVGVSVVDEPVLETAVLRERTLLVAEACSWLEKLGLAVDGSMAGYKDAGRCEVSGDIRICEPPVLVGFGVSHPLRLLSLA